MLKITFCLVRKAELTRDEFQLYWRDNHAPLVAAAREALGIKRYVQCHTVPTSVDAAVRAGRDMPEDDFDGVAELWFESEEALIATFSDPEGARHGAILLEDESKFIDFARSRIFFGEENVVIGD